jgi:hypothetical protein
MNIRRGLAIKSHDQAEHLIFNDSHRNELN